MRDLEEGERGVAAAIIDGDTFELDSGLKVQLTGIVAPSARNGEKLSKEARAGLEKLALGRPVRLAYGGEKRLEELALAQVFVQTEGGRWIWAQEAMLREGLARVRTWKTNKARAEQLYAAEAAARAAKRGVWAEKEYAIAAADALSAEARGFQVVEGEVEAVEARPDRSYLNFGADYRRDFTIAVAAENVAAWSGAGAGLSALKGKRVRVRGFVRAAGGPLIEVDHPEAIEILN